MSNDVYLHPGLTNASDVGLYPSAVLVSTFHIDLTEFAAADDSLFRTLATSRNPTDSAPATDVLNRSTSLVRGITEGVALTDSVSRGLVLGRDLPEEAPLQGDVTRGLLFFRYATDAAVATDSVVRRIGFFRSAADTAGGNDALSRSVVLLRALTDSALALDGIYLIGGISGAIRTEVGLATVLPVPSLADLARITSSPGYGEAVLSLSRLAVTPVTYPRMCVSSDREGVASVLSASDDSRQTVRLSNGIMVEDDRLAAEEGADQWLISQR